MSTKSIVLWTEKDDRLLADTVKSKIILGESQGQAFKEAGYKLNRTAAACAFRWSSVVKLKFNKEIEKAKQQKNEKKVKTHYNQNNFTRIEREDISKETEQLKVKHILSAFSELNNELNLKDINRVMRENEALFQENRQLKKEILAVSVIIDRLRLSLNIDAHNDIELPEVN
ncbi:hypothetical protein CR203_23460 [Salipaludibacillus neizhouensis]|uniref:RsfA family transcriptional regulator n=1 Tax=Salipaludibacillus neizhouensis TaxID=885475 RepID=A0A3A9JXP1_9BACI|nr:hypothetical protein [Salipaludibacillus neizhouensis]RKL64969.1 hypothetical protein CR203_23460 [Salipaludibacillus neizhouensis]